jgi:hypothetical protein
MASTSKKATPSMAKKAAMNNNHIWEPMGFSDESTIQDAIGEFCPRCKTMRIKTARANTWFYLEDGKEIGEIEEPSCNELVMRDSLK